MHVHDAHHDHLDEQQLLSWLWSRPAQLKQTFPAREVKVVLVYAHKQASTDLFQPFKDLSSAKGCQMQPGKLIIITVYDDLHDSST